jgi:hypothetical protein
MTVKKPQKYFNMSHQSLALLLIRINYCNMKTQNLIFQDGEMDYAKKQI